MRPVSAGPPVSSTSMFAVNPMAMVRDRAGGAASIKSASVSCAKVWVMSASIPSTDQRSGRDPADDVSLEDEHDQNERQGDDHRGRANVAPGDVVPGRQKREADRDCLMGDGVGKGEGKEKLVPGRDE